MQLANDQLELDIAKLEGKRRDLTKFQIDRIVVEGTETARRIAVEIHRILSQPKDPAARDLRARLSDLDKRLDDISDACYSGGLAAKTVKEAQAACADLDSASRQVNR